jgi:hypothetical protein
VLLTGRSGTESGPNLTDVRVEELRAALSDSFGSHVYLNTRAAFRAIAIANIERDFQDFSKNLVLLGATLALVAEATVYCVKSGITVLASGAAKYQSTYAEQREVAVDIFREFLSEYGIRYEVPVYGYDTELQVKYDLFAFGVSTKSLESNSIFADSFSMPEDDTVKAYLESKLSVARDHINLRLDRSSP